MRVSMYGATCAQRAKRTLAPGYLGRTISWAGTCAVRSQIEDHKELGVVGMSVSHRLFDSKHRLSKPKPAGCSTARPCPAATSSVDRANAHALLLPRQLALSSLSCAARFIFFMERTGMTEASKQRRLLLNGVSATPARVALVGDVVVSRGQLLAKVHADGLGENVFTSWF